MAVTATVHGQRREQSRRTGTFGLANPPKSMRCETCIRRPWLKYSLIFDETILFMQQKLYLVINQ